MKLKYVLPKVRLGRVHPEGEVLPGPGGRNVIGREEEDFVRCMFSILTGCGRCLNK